MESKTALISGGNGYVGTHIAQALVARGWRVASLGRSVPAQAQEGVTSYACDVTDAEAVERTVAEIVDERGQIDAVVHAASAPIEGKQAVWEAPQKELEAHVSIALLGAQALARAAVPHMPQGAAFIGVTSALIEPGVDNAFTGPYVAGKYALRGFLRALSSDTQSRGLRVYAVAPGYMPGGLNNGVAEPVLAMLAKKTGAGRSTPEDTATLIAALCAEPNAHQSGVSLTVSPATATPL